MRQERPRSPSWQRRKVGEELGRTVAIALWRPSTQGKDMAATITRLSPDRRFDVRRVPPRLLRDWMPPPIDDVTRRDLLKGIGALGVGWALGGCGTEGQRVASPTPTAEGTRTVAHRYGSTEVPDEPQRVVVLHSSTILSTALRVGAPVVATAFPPSGEGLVPYLPGEVKNLENVGWLPEFNLEKITSLRPDLIVGSNLFIREDVYSKLSEIAPTVAFEMSGSTDWKQDVRETAALFAEVDEVEDDIAAFELRVKEFRAALGDRGLNDLEVTLVQIRGTDDIRIHTNDWCAGQVLEEAGIGRPDNQQTPDPPDTNFIKISQERLSQLDSDAIFYWVGSSAVRQEKAEAAASALTDSALWKQLEAVKAGRAYRVDPSHWFTCGPIEAQNLILDDLEKHLLGEAS